MQTLALAFVYALIIFLIIISIWYYWSMYIYRYSKDRLANLALTKYSAKNINKLDPTGSNYFNYDPNTIKFINNTLTLNILLKDKKTQTVQSTFPVSYKYSNSCQLIDFNCIR
jgi:hypothetical protein